MAEMNIAEFEDLAAAWGADLALWPSARRAAAQALLAGPEGDAARAALAEARALDLALTELAAEDLVSLPDALTARILADAAEVSADRARAASVAPKSAAPRRSWLADLVETFGGWRMAAISAAACALIGLGAGYATPDSAVAALGYESTATAEEMVANLGWDAGSDLEEFVLFGDAG